MHISLDAGTTVLVTYLPPRHRTPTASCALDEALLHTVGHLPPALRFRVLRDPAHIGVIVRAGVLEVGDEQLERRVVVDGVVDDVVPLECRKDPRPDGGVDLLVRCLRLGLQLYDRVNEISTSSASSCDSGRYEP